MNWVRLLSANGTEEESPPRGFGFAAGSGPPDSRMPQVFP
jgi:hypothetical protein